jgi:hypothetical protein
MAVNKPAHPFEVFVYLIVPRVIAHANILAHRVGERVAARIRRGSKKRDRQSGGHRAVSYFQIRDEGWGMGPLSSCPHLKAGTPGSPLYLGTMALVLRAKATQPILRRGSCRDIRKLKSYLRYIHCSNIGTCLSKEFQREVVTNVIQFAKQFAWNIFLCDCSITTPLILIIIKPSK